MQTREVQILVGDVVNKSLTHKRMTNAPKDWNKCEVYVFLQSEAVSLLRNVKN